MIYEKWGVYYEFHLHIFNSNRFGITWGHISEHIFEVFLNSFNEEQCILNTGATKTWPKRQD